MSAGPSLDSTIGAITWAEEFASRPDCQSQIGKWLHNPDGLKMGREDLRDLALTITGYVSATEPPCPFVLRILYGAKEPDYFLEVASQMSHQLHLTEHGVGKEIAKLRGMSVGVLERARSRTLAVGAVGMRRIAELTGVSAAAFVNTVSWAQLLVDAEEILETWNQRVLYHVSDRLYAAGLLYDS